MFKGTLVPLFVSTNSIMSVFAGHDVSLNKYHYVFYSFSKSEPNTLKAQFYDSGQNLLGTQNISFSQRDIPAMLTFLENSESNPYALGKSPSGFRNMDIAFSGIYKKALKDSQQQSLMTYVNKTFKNVYSNAVTMYEVKVNGSMKYVIDDVEQPNLVATQIGTYVFDQSDPSNSGHLLKFRNLSDSTTPYTTNVTHEGTPGTPNSYSIIDVTQDTPDLQYYCENHTSSMYGEFKTLTDLTSYRVKVVDNILGDPVFSLSPPGTDEYYNQIDVSFGAGSKILFDVSHPTMADISFVFGTAVDNSSTIIDSFVTYQDGVVILDICSGYVGDSLKYFEDTSAGMGYVEASVSYSITTPHYNINPLNSNRTYTRTYDTTWGDSTYDGNRAWIPPDNDRLGTANADYMTIDCGSDIGIVGLRLQGRPGYSNHYVAKLTIDFSSDGSTYSPIDNGAEFDASSTAGYADFVFATPVLARYIKITPTAIKASDGFIAMRAGLIEGTVNAGKFYTVDVSNGVFRLDSGDGNGFDEKPSINFNSGTTYVFDLSHNSNAGNTLVLGTVPDSSVNLIDYQTIVGTPGQPGAYTSFTASGETVYYYSFESSYMGYQSPYTIVSVSKDLFYPGETTTIRVKNTTPYDGAYTITLTNISQSDLNNADLSGSIPKQAITDFTYSIPADVTNVGSFTYSIDGTDISETIQITEAPPIYRYTVEVSGGVYWLQQKDNIGPLGSNYQQPSLPQFESGFQYEFHYTDNNHPIRLSTTIDGTHGGGTEYTTGVTFDTASTPNKLIFIAEEDINLHYYCQHHDSYGDTATSTVYKTYLENRTLYAKFDVGDMSDLQGTHTGAHNIITNHGSAGDNAIIELNRFTNGTNYSPDVSLNTTEYQVGNASLYNPYPYSDAIGPNNAPRMVISNPTNISTGDKHTGSFMVWIKRLDNSNLFLNGTPSNNKNVFFTTYNHNTGYRITIKLNDSNQYYIQMNDDDDLIFLTDNAVAGQTQDSNYNFGTDITQWNHLAFTSKSISDTQYTITIYLNGNSTIKSKTFDKSGYDYFQTGNWALIHENNYYYFQGYIDDLRFYDQWMTDSEINAVYNGTL